MSNTAIDIKGLTKLYQGQDKQSEHLALDNVSLSIPQGEIYGLLGPNGAGKSTLINILGGLVFKTQGSITVMDYDIDTQPQECKYCLGVVPQELNIDPFFTPKQILDLHAGLFGVRKKDRKTDYILELMHLQEKANATAQDLSGGMRRRLMVAKAMVHKPKILILDEPTAGVDVELRHTLWEVIHDLHKQGTTIVLTTHYLEEAESICEKIAILNHGRIVANDTTRNLIDSIDSKILSVQLSKKITTIPEKLKIFNTELKQDNEANQILSISYKPSAVSAQDILQALTASDLKIQDIKTVDADLEDIFLQLTK